MPLTLLSQQTLRSTLGIGASEVATVCHASPWQSAFELWLIKTGRVPKPPTTKAMEFGNQMESVALEAYCKQHVGHGMQTQVAAQHPELEFLRGIADGWHPELKRGVEIKVPSGESLLDDMARGEIPRHYQLQCTCLMDIFDTDTWDVWVWNARTQTGELAVVHWDDFYTPETALREFWKSTAIPLLEEFWQSVESDSWPDTTGQEIPEDKWNAALSRRLRAEEIISEGQRLKDVANEQLKQLLGFAGKTTMGGYTASWRKIKPSYNVEVTTENEAAQATILKALAPLRNAEGIGRVEAKTRNERRDFILKRI